MQPISWVFDNLLYPFAVPAAACLLFLSTPTVLQAQEVHSAAPAETPRETSRPTVEKIQLHKHGDSPFETAGIKGTLNGSHTIEYLIEAKTGQSLELDLRSDHAQAGYRITAPAAPRALHKGQGQHSRYSGTLPRDGTYRVLIFLMEAAARNGERAEFVLNIRIRNPG